MSSNTLPIILWRETHDKGIDKNKSIIIMEIMNTNKSYIIIQGPSVIEFFSDCRDKK